MDIQNNNGMSTVSCSIVCFVDICQLLVYNIDIINLGLILMFVTGMRVGELVTLK